MDWDLAIKRNSEALKGIVVALFAMLGLDGTSGRGFHTPSTAPCCVSSGPPNPPSGALLSLRPGAWW